MTKKIALVAVAVSLIVGVIVGAALTAQGVQAQSRQSRFHTERDGELLFIRYSHGPGSGNLECYLAVDNAGVIAVPCAPTDYRVGRN